MIRDPLEYYYRIVHKPERTRKLIVAISTAVFTLIVFVIWASTLSLEVSPPETAKVAASPLASIFEGVQSLIHR